MRQIVALIAKVGVTAALLYLALGRTDFSAIGARLNHLNVLWLAIAVAIAALQIMLGAIRWRRIAAQCAAPLEAPRAFRFMLIATFFNQVLPSTVGGDAMRMWLLAREGAGWSKATYSVLIDRFIGVLMLAVLVVICLPWSLELVANPIGRIALLLIGFGSVVGAAVFIALGVLRWPALQRWWATRHLVQLAVIARKLLTDRATVLFIAPLSLLIHVMSAVLAWCAARSVGAPFDAIQALLLIPPILLIASVPISIAGWGVREKSLVLAFAYAGLPETDGFLVSVLLGASMFVVGIVGGIVWLVSGEPLRPIEPAVTDQERR